MEFITDINILDIFETRWGNVRINDGLISKRRRLTAIIALKLFITTNIKKGIIIADPRRRNVKLLRNFYLYIVIAKLVNRIFRRNQI